MAQSCSCDAKDRLFDLYRASSATAAPLMGLPFAARSLTMPQQDSASSPLRRTMSASGDQTRAAVEDGPTARRRCRKMAKRPRPCLSRTRLCACGQVADGCRLVEAR